LVADIAVKLASDFNSNSIGSRMGDFMTSLPDSARIDLSPFNQKPAAQRLETRECFDKFDSNC
jgi:hypothetical protein